ncbi:hypothetical protein A4X06_0g1854 [Tilletia controversa]|uniref:DUF2415 domain-containing protein n=1 Tax=Tilletia controversa TaxID=13291 RepID=A0A8X7MWW3_9BASI|nr:hypothetical protein CF328_g1397 [Tilletia controversa]KAE8252888.1 hypothetical protein A4X06_0g1854 [Tilletia controversa]
MTRKRDYISVDYAVKQRANIMPPHNQLKDLLWPGTSSDSVIYVSGYQVKEINYSSDKLPREQPCCISVGSGIIAAGGHYSELAVRLLPSPLGLGSGSGSSDGAAAATAAARNPWTFRPSHGGVTVNTVNAISIVPSYSSSSSSEYPYASTSSHPGPSRRRSNYGILDSYDAEGSPLMPSGMPNFSSDLEASHQASLELAAAAAVQDLLDEEEEDERARREMAAAYGYSPYLYRRHQQQHQQQQQQMSSGSGSSSAARQTYNHASSPPWAPRPDDMWSMRKSIRDGARSGSNLSSSHPPPGENEPSISSCRINVSTNERTVRSYRVRTPRASAMQYERFPGLVPIRTAHFPTEVNHTSTSPDRRSLVAVGDSNDVFMRRILPSGELEELSTLRGSGGGSFSTSWHPSGLQFAVGSSDGRVHVWDVRSSKPLTCLETASGTPAVIGSTGDGDTDAIRTVKYSPCGRMLAYAQHMDAFHVVETVSYENSQRIAAPKLLSGAGASSARHQGDGGGGGGSSYQLVNNPPFNGGGPFAGPEGDDEGDGAPEAPPPQLPRHFGDRGPSRFYGPSSDPRYWALPRSRYAAPHPYGWEDVGSGGSGFGRIGSGASSSSSSTGGVRDFGYRSSLRHSNTTHPSTVPSLGSSSGSVYRRSAAPWFAPSSSTNWYSNWGHLSGSGTTYVSSPTSSGATFGATPGAASSSLSTVLNDALRRSRVHATAEEQRAARQAHTYQRRSLLDGRDWTATVPTPPSPAPGSSERFEPELSPPPAATRSAAYAAYLRGTGGEGTQTRHGAPETQNPNPSTIWFDIQPEDGMLVLPPTPALPSRQHMTQPFRSRSPFSGTEISPEHLEEIDRQSWSAIHNYQRRSALPSHILLTGLCWEPSGSALYCSTEDVVARYPVLDLRLSSAHASLA